MTLDDVTAVTIAFARTPVPKADQVLAATAAMPVSPEITALPPAPLLLITPCCRATAAVVKSCSRMSATQPAGGRRAKTSPARWASASISWAVPSGLPTIAVGAATGISDATS